MSTLHAAFQHRFKDGFTTEFTWEQQLDRFSLSVLFGPSGCGKSTVLRCLAGLLQPRHGSIRCGSEVWFDASQRINRTPQQRNIGFLFQDYALFPHLTVAQNLSFGLLGYSAAMHGTRVQELIDLFQLHGLEKRYPHQVSGGQQQRIALARAMARKPRLLMLDEPFSALDAPTREQLRLELRRHLHTGGFPSILVTHDRIEAMSLADQILVMEDGQVRQRGTVSEVFSRPADLRVARIVGTETVSPGVIEHEESGLVAVAVGPARLLALPPSVPVREVYVCIRGEEVVLQHGTVEPSSARNRLPAVVKSLTSEGPMVRVQLDAGFPLTALITRPSREELGLAEGTQVIAVLKVPAVHLIPRS